MNDFDTFHDRFIIIDHKEIYFVGASFNTKLDRAFAVIKPEDDYLLNKILEVL